MTNCICRRKNHWSRETNNRISLTHGGQIPPETTSVDGHSHDATGSKASQPELEATGFSFKNEIQHLGKNLARKVEFIDTLTFYFCIGGFMIIPNLYMFHMLDVASLFVLYLTMQ